MDVEIINVLSQTLWTAAAVVGPILIVSLVIGVVVGLFQSVVQVQEPTLTFVPKLMGVAGVLIVAGNWMMLQMTQLFQQLLQMAPGLIKL